MIRIGKVLQDAGLVTRDDVDKALAEQKKTGSPLGQILVQSGKITEKDLLKCVAAQMHIGFVSLKGMDISKDILQKMPVKYVWHYKVMPVRLEKETLTVALAEPANLWTLEDIKVNLKMQIEPVFAVSEEIEEAIHKYYGVGADTIEKILSSDGEKKKAAEALPKAEVEDVTKLAGAASIIKLVNQILKEAIENRATDIHFEPFENELVIRYRIDGVLQPTKVAEDIRYLYQAIVARIKIMTTLDIVERRIPQGGGARVKLGDHEYDLRISVIPGIFGESVVIRILPTEMMMDLSQLGMPPKEFEMLKNIVQRSHGIVYVTGPTGSGKSTTLYACLNFLKNPGVKIITVEDPVEYNMKYIQQIQVNPKTGLTFSKILRSVLRHDPDIIMVGEVRDLETAEIAVQASLTGHLVLSTLHTNDAPSAVTRLLDMGVEPYLVSSSVVGVVAQRLVRKICASCAKDVSLPPSVTAPPVGALKTVKRGVGCEKCRFTGYVGRMAIYEILPFSEALKEMIMKKATADEIRKVGVKEGMRTLFESGWLMVQQGLTTPEEIYRVVQGSHV